MITKLTTTKYLTKHAHLKCAEYSIRHIVICHLIFRLPAFISYRQRATGNGQCFLFPFPYLSLSNLSNIGHQHNEQTKEIFSVISFEKGECFGVLCFVFLPTLESDKQNSNKQMQTFWLMTIALMLFASFLSMQNMYKRWNAFCIDISLF